LPRRGNWPSCGGIDIHAEPVRAKKLLGYVPDEPMLYEKLTGREFLSFTADLYRVEEKRKQRWAGSAEAHLLCHGMRAGSMPGKKRRGILRLRGPLWALAKKEMLMVRRDLREWMEGLNMLVIW
jgi:hypothetical protein